MCQISAFQRLKEQQQAHKLQAPSAETPRATYCSQTASHSAKGNEPLSKQPQPKCCARQPQPKPSNQWSCKPSYSQTLLSTRGLVQPCQKGQPVLLAQTTVPKPSRAVVTTTPQHAQRAQHVKHAMWLCQSSHGATSMRSQRG